MRDIALLATIVILFAGSLAFLSGYLLGKAHGWVEGFNHSEKSRDWWHIRKQRERLCK